jgi:hypothetical protein
MLVLPVSIIHRVPVMPWRKRKSNVVPSYGFVLMIQERESYSCSDLGSDSFLGDVLFNRAMNSRPEAGMPTFP